MKKGLQLLVPYVIRFFHWVLRKTVYVEAVGLAAVEEDLKAGWTPIFACPHQAILPAILCWDGRGATFVASLSKDGEFITTLLKARGFDVVRGSSSRGGAEALHGILSATREGRPIGITFDGPRGPALVPKRGVAVCAKEEKARLYFVHFEPVPNGLWKKNPGVFLRSWDRFYVPKPFSALRFHFTPIPLPDKSLPVESFEKPVLEAIERLARQNLGHRYVGWTKGQMPGQEAP